MSRSLETNPILISEAKQVKEHPSFSGRSWEVYPMCTRVCRTEHTQRYPRTNSRKGKKKQESRQAARSGHKPHSQV